MTENKRFNVKQRQGATNYSIIDYYGELPLSEGIYYKSNAEKLCKWLNTQHELLDTLYNENEQLKQYVQSSKKFRKKVEDFFQKCDIDTVNFRVLEELIDADNLIYEKYLKLEEENKQLKSALKELKEIGDYQYGRINELNDENKQLKEIITGQRDTIKRDNEWENKAIEEIKELKKENEQLKSALKELKEIGDYQYSRINELHEENKQLKQQLEDCRFALRTELAHQRVEKEEHSDSVYVFKKKIEKW